jgi:hypothetical protein
MAKAIVIALSIRTPTQSQLSKDLIFDLSLTTQDHLVLEGIDLLGHLGRNGLGQFGFPGLGLGRGHALAI